MKDPSKNAERPLPSGTVTFLFTDIEGSTDLAQRYPEAMPALLKRHDAILHEAITQYCGVVFKTIGDAFCAAFASADEALNATLAAQRALQHEAWSPASIKVRMGLNSGAAQPELEAGRLVDYSGYLTLTLVQRVMSTAFGGQILISNATAELLHGHLPQEIELRDMGEHRLKGLLKLERLWQIAAPDLISEFPALHTLNVVTNNLPAQLTSFIGRAQEIKDIKQALSAARIVTLTGAGGTGKTRLAYQVATELLDTFPDGVHLIELAPLSDPSLISQSLAAVLGLHTLEGGPVMPVILDYLRDKKTLLILDNCEHLVAASARLADELLKACQSLKILASSREALGIAGESTYHVPSLSLPAEKASLESLQHCEAAQLFIDRATAANPQFALTPQNAASIALVCRHLDGIPLALELAAARVKVFSVDQIADRLNDRFRLLTGGSRTALPRQQTLRAAIDWSYDLLQEDERLLLRRLSVFVNGWTFEAAEAVCGDANVDVLDLLPHLVDKSLVVVEQHGAEDARYGLLETIRQYARGKMEAAGENDAQRDRHAAYFKELVILIEPKLYTSTAQPWVDTLEAEYDNIRAALDWLIDQDVEAALRIIAALSIFWIGRGYHAEGRSRAEAAVARAEALPPATGLAAFRRKQLIGQALGSLVSVGMADGDNAYTELVAEKCAAIARDTGDKALLARALCFAATGRISAGDTTCVEGWVTEALSAARDSGNPFALGMALGLMAEILMILDRDPETVQAYSKESLAILATSDNQWGQSMMMLSLGAVAKYKGHYVEARTQFTRLEALLSKTSDKHRLNVARSELAHIDRYEGHTEPAERLYFETIVEWQKLGHRAAVANQLECLAFIANARLQNKRAATMLGAAEILRETIKMSMTPVEQEEYNQQVGELRTRLDQKVLEAAWNSGRLMSMDQAIAFALDK